MAAISVIVTGASRGIGAELARILAQYGANLVLTARSANDLTLVAGEIERHPGSVRTIDGDITDPALQTRLVQEAIASFGRLDALVNNASIIEPIAPAAEAELAEWERNWAVNVLAPVMLTREALPHLRGSAGRIVHVSSGAAEGGIPGWAAYSASKAALNRFNAVLAKEEPSITTVAYNPSVTDTAMQETIRRLGGSGMPSKAHQRFLDYYERGELRPPEAPALDIAVLALFAPADWSGKYVRFDAEDLIAFVKQHTDDHQIKA